VLQQRKYWLSVVVAVVVVHTTGVWQVVVVLDMFTQIRT
jgi:hypothetical protein